ncbi:pyruvoyl-dependent arginine decarboxylase [Halosimplex salinum]|uniref:pyruvoyl-dependent arginine decarboxylase n=1 Tax=Halosimplex salinum TaxID=1710538 RepID=UPI000F4A565D|nr:pyruvoyl-dependent arginine decarboxylase [Halosimplex salinum]
MSTIRVAWGSATGPTAMSSFDAALAEAGVHNYNLVALSSVVPAEASVERVGTAPDLGPAGDALYAVVGRETLLPGVDGDACAGLGWIRSESGRGLFYEASGTDPDAVERAVRAGLQRGTELREWTFSADPEVVVESVPAHDADHATAVVVAAYGDSESLLD